jgi:hypothetical protein
VAVRPKVVVSDPVGVSPLLRLSPPLPLSVAPPLSVALAAPPDPQAAVSRVEESSVAARWAI